MVAELEIGQQSATVVHTISSRILVPILAGEFLCGCLNHFRVPEVGFLQFPPTTQKQAC